MLSHTQPTITLSNSPYNFNILRFLYCLLFALVRHTSVKTHYPFHFYTNIAL